MPFFPTNSPISARTIARSFQVENIAANTNSPQGSTRKPMTEAAADYQHATLTSTLKWMTLGILHGIMKLVGIRAEVGRQKSQLVAQANLDIVKEANKLKQGPTQNATPQSITITVKDYPLTLSPTKNGETIISYKNKEETVNLSLDQIIKNICADLLENESTYVELISELNHVTEANAQTKVTEVVIQSIPLVLEDKAKTVGGAQDYSDLEITAACYGVTNGYDKFEKFDTNIKLEILGAIVFMKKPLADPNPESPAEELKLKAMDYAEPFTEFTAFTLLTNQEDLTPEQLTKIKSYSEALLVKKSSKSDEVTDNKYVYNHNGKSETVIPEPGKTNTGPQTSAPTVVSVRDTSSAGFEPDEISKAPALPGVSRTEENEIIVTDVKLEKEKVTEVNQPPQSKYYLRYRHNGKEVDAFIGIRYKSTQGLLVEGKPDGNGSMTKQLSTYGGPEHNRMLKKNISSDDAAVLNCRQMNEAAAIVHALGLADTFVIAVTDGDEPAVSASGDPSTKFGLPKLYLSRVEGIEVYEGIRDGSISLVELCAARNPYGAKLYILHGQPQLNAIDHKPENMIFVNGRLVRIDSDLNFLRNPSICESGTLDYMPPFGFNRLNSPLSRESIMKYLQLQSVYEYIIMGAEFEFCRDSNVDALNLLDLAVSKKRDYAADPNAIRDLQNVVVGTVRTENQEAVRELMTFLEQNSETNDTEVEKFYNLARTKLNNYQVFNDPATAEILA